MKLHGKKVLVTDEQVGELLSTVLEQKKVLVEHGIDDVYYLDTDILSVETTQIIFFVRPIQQHMKRIVRIIRNNQLNSNAKNYQLIFCPRSNIICREYLEKEAVMGNLTIQNFNFDLIPIEAELLSLEMNEAYNQLYLNQDLTTLNLVAESIQRMELIFGGFNNIYAKGDYAKYIIEILNQKEKAGLNMDDNNSNSKMDTLIIIDRQIDLVTPFCTPFTYEALIDEFYSIRQNSITLNSERFKIDKQKVMKLSAGFDPIFTSMKDYNIKKVINYLEKKRNENKSTLQQKKQPNDEEYLEKMKLIQKEHHYILDHYIVSTSIVNELDSILFNLTMAQEAHTLLQVKQEDIDNHIDYLMALQCPIHQVLKLIILNCQIQNGIKPKLYDHWRREIIQIYGIQHILTLSNLEKSNLLRRKVVNESSIWDKIKQPLRLINENVDHDDPKDFSYIYLAYAAISIRLVEEILQNKSWKNILSSVRDIKGETIIQQNLNLLRNKNKDEKPPEEQQTPGCIVVYFIGGVCYGEIAAIRWLAQTYNKEIIICTTNITSSSRIINSMINQEIESKMNEPFADNQ